MLQIVFPALFQTEEFLDLLGEAHLPKLDRLLARGRRERLEHSSVEALLCQELGIARQHDWPIAPVTLAQAGGQPGTDYWLRADPVHVRIERDRVILNEIPEPGADEARLLCEALSAHFGEEFSPQVLRPGAWMVRLASPPVLATTPLSRAAGQHIDPLLPAGSDTMHWRRLLNEAQMLLFHHPLNQAREARGEPAINSVWLWGGGCLPVAKGEENRVVFADHADWRALAEFAGAETRMLPGQWSPAVPDDALLVLEQPHRYLRQGDFKGWLKAVQGFETNWLQPLLASGRSFRIDDPLQGSRLVWRSVYRWKFWRRPPKPARQKFELSAPASAGIDPFGNRYE
jgi:hypothetical protein